MIFSPPIGIQLAQEPCSTCWIAHEEDAWAGEVRVLSLEWIPIDSNWPGFRVDLFTRPQASPTHVSYSDATWGQSEANQTSFVKCSWDSFTVWMLASQSTKHLPNFQDKLRGKRFKSCSAPENWKFPVSDATIHTAHWTAQHRVVNTPQWNNTNHERGYHKREPIMTSTASSA